MQNIVFVIFLFLSSFLSATNPVDVKNLSAIIDQISHEVKGTVYLGGGSARAVLDYLYFQKPLQMRDLDVFYVAGWQIDEEYARSIGERLESPEFGVFSENDLRNRPRGSQHLPILQRSGYNAGYGFHWLKADGQIIDLSIFHTEKDLALNGLFDIDQIMIVLSPERTLSEFALQAASLSYEQLIERGWIKDPHLGYTQWQKKDPVIVNWTDIESDPILRSFRVIYTYSKVGQHTLPSIVEKNLEYLVSLHPKTNGLQLTRSLLKILDNQHVYQQLQILNKIGVLHAWSPPLRDLLHQLSEQELQTLFQNASELNYGSGNKKALGKIKALIDLLPLDNQLEVAYDTMYAFSPETALVWMFSALGNDYSSEKMVELTKLYENTLNKEHLDKTVARIAKSTLLPSDVKKEMLLKTLLRQVPIVERAEWLHIMMGEMPADEKQNLLAQVDHKRIGFYTGAFNPMHLGHREVVKNSIEQQALDCIFVIPTIATRHNGDLCPWEDRLMLAQISLQDIPEAKVVPRDYKKELLLGTGTALKRLFKENDNSRFIHVMGTDSFERYAKDGHLEDAGLSQEHEVMVIHRPGTKFYPIPPSVKRHVYYYIDQTPAGGLIYSSSKVRRLLEEGRSIDGQVVPEASDYIKRKHLYQPISQAKKTLVFVTSNDHKYNQASYVLNSLKRVQVDIPILQGVSPEELVKAKLQAGLDYADENVIVMESFMFIDSLNNLPGPLTKDFMQTLGNTAFLKLLENYPDHEATVKTIVGYAKKKDEMYFFEAEAKGKIQRPQTLALDLEEWQALFVSEEKPTTQQAIEKLHLFLNDFK